MLDRLYMLLKKKPRRVELEWFEVDLDALEPGLERSFILPLRRIHNQAERPPKSFKRSGTPKQ